jgi:hypothetical protein
MQGLYLGMSISSALRRILARSRALLEKQDVVGSVVFYLGLRGSVVVWSVSLLSGKIERPSQRWVKKV